jgi:NADH-quinone oxidoreductase subunit H
MDIGSVIGSIVMAAIVAFALVTGFAYMTLFERKVVARIQVRLGPNRVGPGGFFQPLADGIKLALKEDVVPAHADRPVFTLAPMISLVVALAAFAVIPFGSNINIFGMNVPLRVTDLNIGILYIFGITSLGVYGIVLAGWSSNNRYSLLGGIRSSAQVISYELAMTMAVLGVLILTGSLSMNDIVQHQRTIWFGFLPAWNIFVQPLAFVIYVIAALAETNRAPFDLPEAEQELIAGYHIEYSSMRFAMFFMAEYINMITVSAIATTLFLGGWSAPARWLDGIGGLPWFLIKVVLFLYFFVWLRATLPRVRYDRLMKLGWYWLLPLSLINMMLTAVVVVWGNV